MPTIAATLPRLLRVAFALAGLAGAALAQDARPQTPSAPETPQATEAARERRQGAFQVALVNEGRARLQYLFMVPLDAPGWGEDRLGADTVEAGGRYNLAFPEGPCVFDLRAVFEGGREEARYGVDLCGDVAEFAVTGRASPPPPERPGPVVLFGVTNRSDAQLFGLFAVPAGRPERDVDLLGPTIVPPGQSFSGRVARTPDCRYDLVMRLGEGGAEEQVRAGVDLCRERAIVLGEGPAQPPAGRPGGQTPGRLDLTIVNRGQTELFALFIRRAGAGGWGPDRFGRDVVPPGRSYRVRLDAQGCEFDVRLVYAESQGEEQRLAQNLCENRELVFTGPREEEGARTLNLNVVNRSSLQLYSIFIRRAGSGEWGSDRFGSSTVPPGGSFPIALRAAGCAFDVQLNYAGLRTPELRENVDLCAAPELAFNGPDPFAPGQGAEKGAQQRAAEAAQVTELRIVNRSAVPIENVHSTSVQRSDWGEDLLTDGVIAPGAARGFRIERDGQCDFDIRVTYVGGREERRMRVNICARPEQAFAGPDARTVDGGGPPNGRLVTVVNTGPIELMEVYLSAADDTHWGPDRLGASTLPRRWRLDLRVPPELGCRFDLRAVFRGGGTVERRNQDLCAQPRVELERRHPANALVSTGTGFYVSAAGHVLTNQHVVDGCGSVAIYVPDGRRIPLRLVAEDEEADLALLVQEGARTDPLTLRSAAHPVRTGDRAVIVGYPARQELGGVNVAEGLISAARGWRGDQRQFQYSAPTQAGNSGGPVFDESGLVIGVVVAQLGGRDRAVQNVNFGIRLDEVRKFLQRHAVETPEAPPAGAQRPADLLERLNGSVLPLDCLG
jgi:S1-C subfamily serine protease